MVSVIIPAYNAENTIEKCIRSIQNQIYNDYEILVINDGSNDDTSSVVNRLAKFDNKLFLVDQCNAGASEARNRGIDIAKGDYITFVDADDEIEEQLIDVLIKTQLKYKADYVKTSVIRIDELGESVRFHSDGNIICESKKEWKEQFFKILNEGLNSPVGKLYKKEILKKYNIRFKKELELSEDLMFNLDYLEKSEKIVFLEEGYYKYCIYNSEATTKYRENLFEKRKYAICLFDNFLERNELSRDMIDFLYVKLLFSEAMSEVLHKTNVRERYRKIRVNLERDEIVTATGKNVEGIMPKILMSVVKTRNPIVIDFVSRLISIVINNKRMIKYRKVSV